MFGCAGWHAAMNAVLLVVDASTKQGCSLRQFFQCVHVFQMWRQQILASPNLRNESLYSLGVLAVYGLLAVSLQRAEAASINYWGVSI